MARIYNPTMLMLDPSNVMNSVRLGREREAQEQEARKGIATGIGELGGALAGIGGRALRQSEIGELPEDSDEEWKAVVERFVDTGDISGINAYKQRKAEEAYRDKMLSLQKLQAEGAKSASEASVAEAKQKDRDILEGQREDAEHGLNDAIVRYRNLGSGHQKDQAKNDYEWNRKKLKRLYKQLGIPEDEIPELEIKKVDVEKEVSETAESGTKEPSSTASAELRLNEEFERGFDDYSDINDFVEKIEEAEKKSISAEESAKLSELKTKALKSVPKKEKERRALKAKVKDAIKFAEMGKAEKFLLKDEEYKRLNDNYKEMTKRGDWEELKKKYGAN